MQANVNKKNSASLPIIAIALCVIIAGIAIVLALGLVPVDHTPIPLEHISESPPMAEPTIATQTSDPLQERMKAMATKNYDDFLDLYGSYRRSFDLAFYRSDFCDKIVIEGTKVRADHGFYTGPLIFFNGDQEVKVIGFNFLTSSGGTEIDPDLKWDRVESLHEFPYPQFQFPSQ
ncbi:MAG: hypothetical protein PHY30_01405 [Candidatus Pacebacteria bacterium]|nr:hypothetical protein [Candidatus Paceibacterota bacterium]